MEEGIGEREGGTIPTWKELIRDSDAGRLFPEIAEKVIEGFEGKEPGRD